VSAGDDADAIHSCDGVGQASEAIGSDGSKGTSVRAKTLRQQQYQLYLQSESWQDLVRQVRERSSGRCEFQIEDLRYIDRSGYQRCDRLSKDVHHLTYIRAGEELLSDLIDVCRVHHILSHISFDCSQCGDSPAVDMDDAAAEIEQLIQDYGSDDMANFYGHSFLCSGCEDGAGWRD